MAKASLQLAAMQLLAGQTEIITMMYLRKHPGDIITQVQMGKTFTITKAGHAVAILSKPEPTALEIAAEIRRLGMLGEDYGK